MIRIINNFEIYFENNIQIDFNFDYLDVEKVNSTVRTPTDPLNPQYPCRECNKVFNRQGIDRFSNRFSNQTYLYSK